MRWGTSKSGDFPRRLYFDDMAELDVECERLVKLVFYKRFGTDFEPPLDDDTLQVLIEAVDAVGLATLASVDPRTIRAAVQEGVLQPLSRRRPMSFSAAAASAYLHARRVPGFGTAPPRG
jgi:hypothetical protein